MYHVAKQLVTFMKDQLNKNVNDEYKKALYEAIAALEKVMKFW